jgi:hypothetical protein
VIVDRIFRGSLVTVTARLDRATQYAVTDLIDPTVHEAAVEITNSGILDRPVKPGDDV